jgi:hypothetical protein
VAEARAGMDADVLRGGVVLVEKLAGPGDDWRRWSSTRHPRRRRRRCRLASGHSLWWMVARGGALLDGRSQEHEGGGLDDLTRWLIEAQRQRAKRA